MLGICNEYMTASRNGERIATFPDLIATADPRAGDALSISELEPGSAVAVIIASKRNFPSGPECLIRASILKSKSVWAPRSRAMRSIRRHKDFSNAQAL